MEVLQGVKGATGQEGEGARGRAGPPGAPARPTRLLHKCEENKFGVPGDNPSQLLTQAREPRPPTERDTFAVAAEPARGVHTASAGHTHTALRAVSPRRTTVENT